MFSQSCFIGKNTDELREKLKKLGYIIEVSSNSECIATTTRSGPFAVGISKNSFYSNNIHTTWNCAGRIDCKDNEDLFLSIASLRDDVDRDQWFILDNTSGKLFVKCNNDNWSIGNNIYKNTIAHKATVKELIEYFENKISTV